MDEDRRDRDKPGRREEDERWLKVQEQIMNLVTAERTDQQELTAMKVEVTKLLDHVEDLDDYLRGVAGEDSLDNRVVLLEKGNTANGVLLRQIWKQLDELKKAFADMRIAYAISDRVEEKKSNKLIRFWLPIIIATFGLLVPFTKMGCERLHTLTDTDYKPDERLRKQIEVDKKSRRAKEVQKKLHDLEKIQAINP